VARDNDRYKNGSEDNICCLIVDLRSVPQPNRARRLAPTCHPPLSRLPALHRQFRGCCVRRGLLQDDSAGVRRPGLRTPRRTVRDSCRTCARVYVCACVLASSNEKNKQGRAKRRRRCQHHRHDAPWHSASAQHHAAGKEEEAVIISRAYWPQCSARLFPGRVRTYVHVCVHAYSSPHLLYHSVVVEVQYSYSSARVGVLVDYVHVNDRGRAAGNVPSNFELIIIIYYYKLIIIIIIN
jgi:hypothetical protein